MSDLQTQFRQGMRRVAATVNIITVSVDGRPMGMVATAVSSLSAEPPSLLACVNQAASLHNSLALATHFCVNVLHCDQRELADTFSNSKLRDVRFATGGWKLDDKGAPYLPDAQATFICERGQLISFATHSIVIGLVTSVTVREDINPLVYLNGRYCRCRPSD